MTIEVVCGINWGDEGKGRMVDYLAAGADAVVRFQGGNNAGHTVVNDLGTFALHLIPSGVFYRDTLNVLGPGMVIDLQGLEKELAELQTAGISCDNVRISDRATIVFPFHKLQDTWEEERLAERAYGSTRNGIAPAYGDRYMKKAIQIGMLQHRDALAAQLEHLIDWKNVVAASAYGRSNAFTFDEAMDWLDRYGASVKDRICDTTELLEGVARRGGRVLLEAQLGALRDIYFGTYPFTTSSSTLAAFAPVGAGLFGHPATQVVGVMKAFSTCVGEGPFVARMDEREAGELREVAKEYGATTGRPRTIGHFDAVASRFGVEVQGATEVALTKLDSLAGRKSLKVCTHYRWQGEQLERFPLNPVLDQAEPVYVEVDGFSEDIRDCRRFDKLPTAARRYVELLEDSVRCPIKYVSVGPERDQIIVC